MQGTSRCRHRQREFYAPVGQSWVWLLALMRAIQSGTCAPDCNTALRDVNYSLWQKEQIGIHYRGRRIRSKEITNGIEAFINPKPCDLLWKWLIALSTSVTSCLHDDFAFYICYYKPVEYISKFTGDHIKHGVHRKVDFTEYYALLSESSYIRWIYMSKFTGRGQGKITHQSLHTTSAPENEYCHFINKICLNAVFKHDKWWNLIHLYHEGNSGSTLATLTAWQKETLKE